MALISSVAGWTGFSDDPASWVGGVVPVDGNSVDIVATSDITLRGVNEWGDDTTTGVQVHGTLRASRLVNSSLAIRGDIRWLNGGVRDFGSIASPILWPVTCTILPNRSSVPAIGKWYIRADNGAQLSDVGGPATRNTQILTVGGVAATGTTFEVAAATGWQVGAKIVLGQTDGVRTHTETATIFSITPTTGTAATIVLTAGVTYAHVQFARIGYLWSNVVYRAYHGSSYAFRIHQSGGSLTPAGSRNIRDVLLDAVQAGVTFADMIRDDSSSTNAWGVIGSLSLDNVNGTGISIFGNLHQKTISNIAAYGTLLQAGWYIGYGLGITLDDCINYGSAGFALSLVSATDIIHNRCEFIHSQNGTMDLNGVAGVDFNDCKFHSSSNALLGRGSAIAVEVNFTRCSIGSTDLPGTTVANGCVTGLSGSLVQWTLKDCNFKSTFLSYSLQYGSYSSYVAIANKNGDPTVQETYYRQGTIVRDNTSKLSGVTSIKLSPTSADFPLTFQLTTPAPSGRYIDVSGLIFKDTVGIVASVTLSGLGITAATYTMTTTGAQELFHVDGVQATGNPGILDVEISVAGTSGSVWVDAVTSPQSEAIDFGDMKYWSNGFPIQLITANYVSAGDVWNSLQANYNLPNSFGALLNSYIDAAVSSRLAAAGYTAPDNAGIAQIQTAVAGGSGITVGQFLALK